MVLTNTPYPLTGPYKDSLEHLRKDHVPRYLFRTWHPACGGGKSVSINTTTGIVPAAFVQNNDLYQGKDLYDVPESELKRITESHYRGRSAPLTEFSSWSHSLALVIGIYKHQQDTHIAVMDTQSLDGDDVKVWHCPHLGRNFNNYEFLAHGPIRGRGYKAVPLSKMLEMGLEKVCPDLERYECMLPSGKRKTFGVTEDDLDVVGRVAGLFGMELGWVVGVALLAVLPRVDVAKIEVVERLIRILGNPSIPRELIKERWLMPGMVDTVGRPDAERYIELLRSVVVHSVGAGNVVKLTRPQFDTFYCRVCCGQYPLY